MCTDKDTKRKASIFDTVPQATANSQTNENMEPLAGNEQALNSQRSEVEHVLSSSFVPFATQQRSLFFSLPKNSSPSSIV
jgi:hypothetical protein